MKSFRPSPTKRAPPRASRRARQGLWDARAPPETASEPRDRSTVACYRSVLALGQCLRTGQSPQDGEIDAHRFWPRAIKSSDSSCQSSLRTLACNAMRTRSGSSLARVHPNLFDTRFTCVSTTTPAKCRPRSPPPPSSKDTDESKCASLSPTPGNVFSAPTVRGTRPRNR